MRYGFSSPLQASGYGMGISSPLQASGYGNGLSHHCRLVADGMGISSPLQASGYGMGYHHPSLQVRVMVWVIITTEGAVVMVWAYHHPSLQW